MQGRLGNLIFTTSIMLIVITLYSNNNDLIKPANVYGAVTHYKLGSIFTHVSESDDEKKSYQLDSSLSSFVDTNKKIVMHIHPQLNVTLGGESLLIPSGIGINITLWNDHSLDQYGMQPMKMTGKDMSMIMQGMSPLHTHDSSGVIHVESNEFRNYTLGKFLQNWGIELDGKEVILSVNGNNIKDYRNHILADKEQMILNIDDQIIVTSN